MVLRRINKISKDKKFIHKGGDSDIPFAKNDELSPIQIPGIALWIKAVPEAIITSTIKSYIETQSFAIQDRMLEEFKDRLNNTVITEIKSDVSDPLNSLVRFELERESLEFPTLIKNSDGQDVISMNFISDISGVVPRGFKLYSKNPMDLDKKYSMWSISKNINFEYNKALSRFIIDIDHIKFLNDGVAEFSEIIVFSRELNFDEIQKMEGYIATKKNELYMLPFNHPYLKDMSYLPALKDQIRAIQEIIINSKKALDEFNKVLNDNRNLYQLNSLYDSENTFRGKITEIIMGLSILKQIFYKGALLSIKRGSNTIESIFQAINDLELTIVPFTEEEYINPKLTEYTTMLFEINTYIQSIKDLKLKSQQGGGQYEINTVHTQNVLEETGLELEAREFYQKLRDHSNKINDLGKLLYAPMNKNLDDQISVVLDYLTYSNKTIDTEMNSLIYTFKIIDAQISTKDWLKYIPSIDTTEVDTILLQNKVYTIQYQNSFLNTIQKLYEKVRNQLQEGDMAFIHKSTANRKNEVEKIYDGIQANTIKPIWNKTFLYHCRQRYYEVDTYMQQFKTLVPIIQNSLKILKTVLEWLKENKSTPTLDSIPVIPSKTTYKLQCQDMYIRKVNISDANITGIQYIITDIQGTILQEPNQSGDLDVSYIFPSFETLDYNKDDSIFMLTHPYRDENGINIIQKFKIIEPFPSDVSIIDSLSELRKPNYWFHKATSLYEIRREEENGIHQFTCDSIQDPIQLPKYALDIGTYFLIQNVGRVAIQVQIPGFPNDTIDVIGPQDSNIYIYSDFKEDSGGSYYGRVYLRNGYIPYDTLLNCSRSKFSVFVKELNAEIYVNETLEPLCDIDGYFIKCLTDENGLTYDIDDVYSVRPYKVKSIKQINISDLNIDRSNSNSNFRVRQNDPDILMSEDPLIGLPVLCNSDGIQGINEFGFASFAISPLIYINGEIHLRGSPLHGDIILKINSKPIHNLGNLEPFIKFEMIYRSSFIQPYLNVNTTSYIFSTYSKYPILHAKKLYIQPINIINTGPNEIKYLDTDKEFKAYILNSEPVGGDLKTLQLPYVNINLLNTQNEFKKSCIIVLNRYDTNKLFIIDCVNKINTVYSEIKEFGQSQSGDMVSMLTNTYKEINTNLDTYNSYSSIVQSIQKGLSNSVGPPGDVKISIDMLDLKMREIIVSCWESFNSAEESMDFFTKLVKDVKNLNTVAKKLRDITSIEIEQKIGEVQATLQNDAKTLKAISSPDIDRLLKTIIQYKIEFGQKLTVLEKDLQTRPSYSTDFPSWIQDRKVQIKNLYALNTKIKNIVAIEIPDAFDMRELLQQQQSIFKLRNLQEQYNSYSKYYKNIQLWLDMNENDTNSQSSPILNTGYPVIKGITIDLIVFDELTNPSVKRDWLPSDSPRVQSELLDPIETIKNTYKDLFLGTHLDANIFNLDLFRNIKSNEMNIQLDTIATKLQTFISIITNFESDLAPILKSYQSIRSDIRHELKNKLLISVKTIYLRWIESTGKRTAFITLHNGSNDINTKMDSIFTSELESTLQDILKGYVNPTYYDTLSLFQLKNEIIKQSDINTRLDKVDEDLTGSFGTER